MNDLSLIYTLPSASSRIVWVNLTSFLPFSLYLTFGTFFGSCSLFNGPDLSSRNSVFVYKKDFHELAS